LPIRADGDGYYAYLPAFFIYGDPSFETLVKEQFAGDVPLWTGLQRHPDTGRYFNKFNLGVAVFNAPFFLGAHGLTWLMRPPMEPEANANLFRFNFPMDGYSPFYQHAMGLAGVIYTWLGFILLRRLLLGHYTRDAVHIALAVILLGTNVLDFGALSSTGSHPVSLFLFGSFFLVYAQWRERGGVGWALLLGSIMGAIVMVRITNIILFASFLLIPLASLRMLGDQVLFLFRRWNELVVMLIAALVVFSPQMIFWNYSCGAPLVNSYGNVGLPYLLSPAIMDVLFSVRKGIFTWFPALILLLPGLVWMFKARDQFSWGVVVILAIQIYIISSAALWYAGGSFGQRYLSEYLALGAFPIARLFSELATRPKWRLICTLFAFTGCLWTIFLFKLYLTREIHIDGLDRAALFDIFWWRFQALLSYF